MPQHASRSAQASIVLDARLLHLNRAGIGRYLRHLYTAMAALGDGARGAGPAVTVLYHRHDRQRVLHGVWPRGTRAWTPPHHRLERWTLALEVARLRPALLHAPDHVCPQPLGWRTVVTVHDLAFRRFPETHSPESRAYYAGLERSLRQAERVICVSEATRRDVVALAGADPAKVRVVHEAPDPAYTADGPAEVPQRSYFVFVGTIEPRKNVAGLLRALAKLPRAERPELRLVGGGQVTPAAPLRGPDSPPGRALGPGPTTAAGARTHRPRGGTGAEAVLALPRQLGIEREVRFLGHLPTEEVAALYRGALALVYPSLLEGFGLPILEAMACGTPVITANRFSMPEVAGGAAELVDPEDTDALAAAMARLSRDAARREELRRRGLARARQFSWQRAARETLAVFCEALRA